MDIEALIAEERHRFADLLDSLTPEQLAAPSLCGLWTVQEVAGHLLAAVAAPRSWLLPAMLRSGFRLHRANAELASRMAQRPAAEIAAGLRRHAVHPFKPPIVGYLGPLTDLQVHRQDICRPLGLPVDLRPEPLRRSLDFLVGRRAVGFTAKGWPAGLRCEAVDLEWAWGSGPVLRGTGEALLMALTGRTVALADLDGDGVPVLRQRLPTAAVAQP
jgi:uncharacterized protein (TIGR03083 family)